MARENALHLLLASAEHEMTTFTRTSPTSGGLVPAGVTEIGGIVIDMIGLNGARVVSQLSASSLFAGTFSANPGLIGTQSGFTPQMLTALGGGIQQLAVRVTLFDGDTSNGNFDFHQNFLRLNGVEIGDFSDVTTQRTTNDGLTAGLSELGFQNNQLNTGWFFTNNAAVLTSFFDTLSSGQVQLQLHDADLGDNVFDFTLGINGSLVNVGSPPNVAPVGNPDSYTAIEDTSLTISVSGVLANDTDAEQNPLTSILVSGPAHGTLNLNTDGSFTYRPAANYNGPDSFTYRANDGAADSSPTSVSINVVPVNDAPQGADVTKTVVEDSGAYTFAISDFGFSDPLDTPAHNLLEVKITTLPGAGSLTLKGAAVTAGAFVSATDIASGLLKFTPAGNGNGSPYANFTFQVRDDGDTPGVDLDPSPNTITFNINAVNDAPVSIAHNYTLGMDGPLTIGAAQGLLSGASDPESDPLSALVATGPEHGTLSLNADGSFVYKAANTFFGEDSFSFKANDGALDSNVSTVKINVTRETSSETTTNPNGGSTTTYYDAKGDKPWTSQSHNFDSNGHETSATVSYDDGSLQGATFDANDNQPWKSQSSVANALGQVTNMGVIYDDGTQQTGIFDAGNNQPWLSQHAVYDALGRMINLGVIYDDGSQQTAIFDAANNQLWSSQNMVYDVHGHLTNAGVIYDDLHTETAVYDVHSDQPWTSQSAVYDPSGSLIAASVRYDDGHVENWHI